MEFKSKREFEREINLGSFFPLNSLLVVCLFVCYCVGLGFRAIQRRHTKRLTIITFMPMFCGAGCRMAIAPSHSNRLPSFYILNHGHGAILFTYKTSRDQ